MKKNPLVSVIILNWNRKTDSIATIKQVLRQRHAQFEVVLVDNASTDGSANHIKKLFPRVKIVQMPQNIGLAAFSSGMKTAKGKYFLMLASDTKIEADLIQKHVQKFTINPDLGVSCPSTFTWPQRKSTGPNRVIKGNNRQGYKVTYFDGNGICIKAEVFRKLGGYNADYFICLEELEWAVRILRAGYDIRCFTDIRIFHKHSRKGGQYRSRLGYWYTRNWLWFYAQYLPVKYIFQFLRLHLNSSRSYVKSNKMQSADYFRGLMAGLLGMPKFLWRRNILSDPLVERVKLDLFPNPYHLYIRHD